MRKEIWGYPRFLECQLSPPSLKIVPAPLEGGVQTPPGPARVKKKKKRFITLELPPVFLWGEGRFTLWGASARISPPAPPS